LKNDQSSIPRLSAFDEKSAMMRQCDPRINESDPPGGTTRFWQNIEKPMFIGVFRIRQRANLPLFA